MKSRINYNNSDNVYVESKLMKNRKRYYEKIKSINKFVKGEIENMNFIPEGTKVKLDYESLVNEPDYRKKVKKYKSFIENNKDTVFTVEYDERHRENPVLVCLKEDTNEVKWLWYFEDLIIVDEDN